MILAQGARGPGLNSQNSPFVTLAPSTPCTMRVSLGQDDLGYVVDGARRVLWWSRGEKGARRILWWWQDTGVPHGQSAGFMHGPTWPAPCSSGVLGILGLCNVLWLEWWRKLNRPAQAPRLPKNPDEKSPGRMHRPKAPQRTPRFLGTLSGPCLMFSKNLGNLGPVHESCTLFIRILGSPGPVQGVSRPYLKIRAFPNIFPVLFGGGPQSSCRGSSVFFGWNFWKRRAAFWPCILGRF